MNAVWESIDKDPRMIEASRLSIKGNCADLKLTKDGYFWRAGRLQEKTAIDLKASGNHEEARDVATMAIRSFGKARNIEASQMTSATIGVDDEIARRLFFEGLGERQDQIRRVQPIVKHTA